MPLSRKKKMICNIIMLFMLYLNIILTFAAIYMVLDHNDAGPIVDHFRSHVKANSWFDPMMKPLYFSAITLLSVGYGDITPFGLSRVVSVIEAMIGFILPATVAVQWVRYFPDLLNQKDDS